MAAREPVQSCSLPLPPLGSILAKAVNPRTCSRASQVSAYTFEAELMLKNLQSKLSVHKLILKNLQSKLLTLLVLSTVLPVSTVGLYGLFSSTRALTELSVDQIEQDVSTQALRIEQLLASVYGDVLMLSQMPPIQGIIRAKAGNGIDYAESPHHTHTTYADWIERATVIFRALMTTRSHYKTLRYLDINGHELVRTDSRNNTLHRPIPNTTHTTAQANFFRGAIALKSGQVYVSDIEMAPPDPLQPTAEPVIHYATPIYDPQGELRGVLVATVFTHSLTELLQSSVQKAPQKTMLVTQYGQYLWHPDPAKRWSSTHAHPGNLQRDYQPTISHQILSGGQGSIHQDLPKIISYATLNPGSNHQMVIIYDQPKYSVFQSISHFKRLSAGVIIFSLGTVLVIGISIVRKLSKSQTSLYEEAKLAAKTAESKAEQLETALQELHTTQSQLVQTEKMSSLGQLVAGVAHEINNPVNFIYGNLTHVDHYTHDILALIQLYQQHYPNPNKAIQTEADAIDIDFLMEDMPKMLASMKVGADRIRQIVLSLRNFSRLDEADMKAVDIHEGIDSTLLILQNRLKARGNFPGVEILKDYGNLPKVECYAGQLNQVFMNLLSNGIDALEDSFKAKGNTSNTHSYTHYQLNSQTIPDIPTITIRTQQLDHQWIQIVIADSGPGIPAEVRDRLFEPFFTTKPIGKGTGLGLSISYQIITEKHGGLLRCVSEIGKGTEFQIEIPIQQPATTPSMPPSTPELPASVA